MTRSSMPSDRLLANAGRLVLFASLAWVPLPFGSVTHGSVVPLILAPGIACLLGLARTASRGGREPVLGVQRHGVVWAAGGLAFVAFVALQLVPVPRPLVRLLSSEAFEIWEGAGRIHGLLSPGGSFRWLIPFTVDPPATRLHLAQVVAALATFIAAALLVRRRSHRVVLAAVLGATATFEVLYGLQQYASHSRAVWGWPNLLIHDRVTGTFVNPNHFAHYLAIVLPVGLYLVLASWERSRERAGSPARALARLLERHAAPAALGALIILVCLGGVLVAQSRGALLAAFVGVGAVLVIRAVRERAPLLLPHRISGSKRRRRRVAWVASLVFSLLIAVVAALAIWIGADRTVRRFVPAPGQTLTLVGRTVGFRAALAVWLRFPLFGSGLGSFDDVVLMTQDPSFRSIFTHAHNDYLEVLATTGIIGFGIAAGTLFAGAWLLLRYAFAPVDESETPVASDNERGSDGNDNAAPRDHHVFALAALAALGTAMVHALFDFNFYIPSNPVTLAAILGAASAIPRRGQRERNR